MRRKKRERVDSRDNRDPELIGVNIAALAESARKTGVRLSALLDATPAAMDVPDYESVGAAQARARFNGQLEKANRRIGS